MRDLSLEETFKLYVPEPETFDFSIESLTQSVEEMAGKQIRYVPANLEVGFFGARVMVAAPDAVIEYIVYNQALPAFHRTI